MLRFQLYKMCKQHWQMQDMAMTSKQPSLAMQMWLAHHHHISHHKQHGEQILLLSWYRFRNFSTTQEHHSWWICIHFSAWFWPLISRFLMHSSTQHPTQLSTAHMFILMFLMRAMMGWLQHSPLLDFHLYPSLSVRLGGLQMGFHLPTFSLHKALCHNLSITCWVALAHHSDLVCSRVTCLAYSMRMQNPLHQVPSRGIGVFSIMMDPSSTHLIFQVYFIFCAQNSGMFSSWEFLYLFILCRQGAATILSLP